MTFHLLFPVLPVLPVVANIHAIAYRSKLTNQQTPTGKKPINDASDVSINYYWFASLCSSRFRHDAALQIAIAGSGSARLSRAARHVDAADGRVEGKRPTARHRRTVGEDESFAG